MIGEIAPERPRRRRLLLLSLRFLLHWLIKLLVLFFMGLRFVLRPRPVRYGLIVLLMVGSAGWSFFGSYLQVPWLPAQLRAGTGNASADIVSAPLTAQLPPPAIVERYIKAQFDFNASGMWDTMSDRLKQRMGASNSSVQQLQTQLDSARQQGRHYTGAIYVGGVATDAGRSMYFYVLNMDSPNGSTQIPYVYIVSEDGKIASIQ